MSDKEMIDPDDLENGQLYVFKNRTLQEIERNDDDSMKRIRITNDAFVAVIGVQRAMQKSMNGYKTDINIICSALLNYAAGQANIEQEVKAYCFNLYKQMDMDERFET